jgi:peptidyl-prolyl cis-trans isomerase SurA
MSSGASSVSPRRRDARWSRWATALLFCVTISTPSLEARATVVERVVAIVGERAILLSDLRERAHPFLLRIQQEVPSGAQRAAAISQLYKSLIERMVDEELEQRAANRARIAVTAREVDEAIARIAAQNGLEIEQLVDEAVRSGLTERQYRNEVRRQVLEAKLLNLRLQGRVRVTEDDLRTAYRRILLEERRKLRYTPAWIRIDAPANLTRDELAKRRTLGEQIAAKARAGDDFAALARLHSNDAATRAAGGVLGEVAPGRLPREIERVALTLEAGESSPPIRSGDAFVIVKVLARQESSLPSFEQAREELAERVYLEKMNKARRHWLDGLRKRTHVEIRL